MQSLVLKGRSTRLVISVSLLIVALVVIAAEQVITSRREFLKRAQVDVHNLNVTLEGVTQSIINQTDNILESVQNIYVSRGYSWQGTHGEMAQMLVRMKGKLPAVDILRIANENGEIISDDVSEQRWDIRDREYFQQQKADPEDRLILSEPLIGKVTKTWAIVLSRKIQSKDHHFKGVVYAVLNLKSLSDVYSNIDLGPGGTATLFNGEDKILARYPYDPEKIGKKIVHSQPYLDLVHEGIHSGVFSTVSAVDGQKKILSFSRFRDLSFTLFVGKVEGYVFRDWYKSVLTEMIILTLLVFVSVYFLYLYLRADQEYEVQRALSIQASKLSALGEMAAGVGHEINNPLAIIEGSISILNRQMESQSSVDPELLNKHLKRIAETTQRIAKIVRGLLRLSRRSQGDTKAQLSLNLIIERSLELTQERFKNHGIELKTSGVTDLIQIHGDEIQLSQVLLNLLNNAFDAVVPQEIKWVKIELVVMGGKKVRVLVTDSGSGIPSEVRAKLMQPFFTTKGVNRGTGLGLSISRTIIEEHGGLLFFDAECPNTRFVIELPLATEIARAEEAQSVRSQGSWSPSI